MWWCQATNPLDTRRKLNVYKTFRRRPRRLLNLLCTFNLRLVSTGKTTELITDWIYVNVRKIIFLGFWRGTASKLSRSDTLSLPEFLVSISLPSLLDAYQIYLRTSILLLSKAVPFLFRWSLLHLRKPPSMFEF